LRNQEAARYARWSAIAAGLIAIAVLGIYAHRVIRQERERRHPPAIPVTVQQQSAEFSFSKVEQDRTIFTIRASQATQFKDENRAVLKDVWISIYGTKGERNDNIHTGECSYEPKSGEVRCEGSVEIDIQGATSEAGRKPENAAGKQIQITTKDLRFNRETGEAYTDEPVQFVLSQGTGQAVGVTYSTKNATVRLDRDVRLQMEGSERTGDLPVEVEGSSLDIQRNNLLVTLNGPATVKQGSRELTAQTISFDLDSQYRVQHATATGNPEIHSTENGAKFEVTADQFEGYLSSAGWMERLAATGNVRGERSSPGGTDHFSATRVDLTMLQQTNLVQEMEARGRVALDTKDAQGTRSLETSALRIDFATDGSAGKSTRQRIAGAETLAPATIETVAGTEKTELAADRFRATFAGDGKFEKLLGRENVRITRQLGTAVPQTSSADEMEAEFAKTGEWTELTQSGNVRFQQGDRGATAQEARIVQSTGTIELDGSPILTDAQSRTSAGKVIINQKTGDLRATGGVITTLESTPGSGSTMGLGAGPAHVSAISLSGSTASGHVIYSGHARLWQGESALDADQIEVWREEQKLRATGNVAAVFPQESGTAGAAPGTSGSLQSVAQKKTGSSSGPTLWNITAPTLTYWGQQGKAHLDGGVVARSEQGTIHSQAMDVYFTPAGEGAGVAQGSKSPQFNKAVATGGVVVTQGDRRGVGEEAEYTAANGKFVLSGGKPTVSDGSGNTTTGHSLTFFVANDTILIDSQTGSRTLTKHRVEK